MHKPRAKVIKTTRVKNNDSRVKVPIIRGLFMKIAEPRVIRVMHFGIYISMMLSGIGTIFHPPSRFQTILGEELLFVFGLFVFLGAFAAAIAVLPGIWWLERVGIIMLTTSMSMYVVTITALGLSVVSISVAVALTLTFAQRWVEIRGAQLAPREV